MNTSTKQTNLERAPSFLASLIPILITGIVLTLSVFVYEAEPHVSILLGGFVAGLVAYAYGFSVNEIQQGLKDSIARALPSLIILLIIGMIISVWITIGKALI
ncbi:hypothetical protein [Desulfitispora alkaliphila]|uniref:hypothetical protein n=1 Tax=Desulfitispora alkaliphila TaxID=622674 RepID=UPI003D1ECEDA